MAIKTQIQFRKILLGAKHKDKVFQMSMDSKTFTTDMMVNNLKEIIRYSIEEVRKVSEPENRQVAGIGEKLIPPEKMWQQMEKYEDMASKEEERAGKRRGENQNSTDNRSAKRTKDNLNNENIPTIVVPLDLVGKRVTHHCLGNDELDWFEGTVIDISETNKDLDFYIRYDGYDSVYLFSYHEFKDGDVKLLPVTVDDFLGKKISQKFEDEGQKHGWWENGRVINIVEGSDEKNPEFTIEFECQPELEPETEDEASIELVHQLRPEI